MKPKSRNPLKRLQSKITDLHERHKERHRPTQFGFVFADRIDFIDPIRWDFVAASNSVFLQRDLLRLVEAHGPDNITPRYAMIFRDTQPVAIVAVQIVTVTGDHLQKAVASKSGSAQALLKRVIAPAVKTARSNFKERMLVAGNLLAWGNHGVGFAPNENPAELWPAVAEAVYRIRRAERLTGQTDLALVKDLSATHTGVEALRRFSYRPLETEPNMVLSIDPSWTNHDAYLAALDSKYRRKAKDQHTKITAAGYTIETLTDIATHAARLHTLYLAVQSNAAVRLVTLRPTFFTELAKAAGERFRCTVVRRGDEIIGFVTSIRDGDTAIGYYIGFDRAAAAEGLPIYLRLLHATIADAIFWRCSRLSLGRTALEPKASLGALPEPMTVWIRHRVPALNWMLRGMLGAVPHAEAPERSPFKTTRPS